MKHSRLAVGLLAAALLAAPTTVFAQRDVYGSNGYHNGNNGQTSGTISSVNGSALKMSNGQTIFLHNGTVINPSGMRLQPGMRISVTGPSAGDGNVNANQINIANNGSYSNSNRNRQYSGVISSVSNGSLMMQDGRTIFLHNGTVINPAGTHLRRGMRITVSGSSSGNGNVNAREVDVAYAGNERR